jgi:hypothetical protein
MVCAFLAGSGLVAVQAGHIFGGMRAELEFMHNRMLQPRMALGAFAGRANQRNVGLIRFDFWPLAVDEQRRQHQAEANDQGDKNGAE